MSVQPFFPIRDGVALYSFFERLCVEGSHCSLCCAALEAIEATEARMSATDQVLFAAFMARGQQTAFMERLRATCLQGRLDKDLAEKPGKSRVCKI